MDAWLSTQNGGAEGAKSGHWLFGSSSSSEKFVEGSSFFGAAKESSSKLFASSSSSSPIPQMSSVSTASMSDMMAKLKGSIPSWASGGESSSASAGWMGGIDFSQYGQLAMDTGKDCMTKVGLMNPHNGSLMMRNVAIAVGVAFVMFIIGSIISFKIMKRLWMMWKNRRAAAVAAANSGMKMKEEIIVAGGGGAKGMIFEEKMKPTDQSSFGFNRSMEQRDGPINPSSPAMMPGPPTRAGIVHRIKIWCLKKIGSTVAKLHIPRWMFTIFGIILTFTVRVWFAICNFCYRMKCLIFRRKYMIAVPKRMTHEDVVQRMSIIAEYERGGRRSLAQTDDVRAAIGVMISATAGEFEKSGNKECAAQAREIVNMILKGSK